MASSLLINVAIVSYIFTPSDIRSIATFVFAVSLLFQQTCTITYLSKFTTDITIKSFSKGTNEDTLR